MNNEIGKLNFFFSFSFISRNDFFSSTSLDVRSVGFLFLVIELLFSVVVEEEGGEGWKFCFH